MRRSSGLVSKSSCFLARNNNNVAVVARSSPYTTHSQLPEEHKMVYEMCRRFADEELAPNAGSWDKHHTFPKAAVAQLVSTVHGCCS
jgi:alkylation response protein AidB-like acyl-CoA dehydrogenase